LEVPWLFRSQFKQPLGFRVLPVFLGFAPLEFSPSHLPVYPSLSSFGISLNPVPFPRFSSRVFDFPFRTAFPFDRPPVFTSLRAPGQSRRPSDHPFVPGAAFLLWFLFPPPGLWCTFDFTTPQRGPPPFAFREVPHSFGHLLPPLCSESFFPHLFSAFLLDFSPFSKVVVLSPPCSYPLLIWSPPPSFFIPFLPSVSAVLSLTRALCGSLSSSSRLRETGDPRLVSCPRLSPGVLESSLL